MVGYCPFRKLSNNILFVVFDNYGIDVCASEWNEINNRVRFFSQYKFVFTIAIMRVVKVKKIEKIDRFMNKF